MNANTTTADIAAGVDLTSLITYVKTRIPGCSGDPNVNLAGRAVATWQLTDGVSVTITSLRSVGG